MTMTPIWEVLMRRYGVLGSGVVARVLAKGLEQHGYEVSIGSRDPGKLAAFRDETGIPIGTFSRGGRGGGGRRARGQGNGRQRRPPSRRADRLAGKVVIDTTNPIADAPPVDGVLQYLPDRTSR